MNTFKRALMILAIASVSGLVIGPAFAANGNGCQRDHPRRNEVMRRDGNINRRINRDRGNADFKANGGYLTKQQQRQLNKEENGLRTDIRQDR